MLIALVLVVVCGSASVTYIDHDLLFALVWGNELTGGQLPTYEGPYSPTPHPLSVAVGAIVSPFGDAAPGLMRLIILLSLAALIVGVFRVGTTLYAWPVGLLAAAIFSTREPVLNFGPLLGYQDIAFAAFIVWAVVLEAERPRRGVAVLVLLALAGLLRPEAWFLAAGYWLWLAPRTGWDRRLRLAGLVAVAPLVWLLSDAIVTGDPLWSLHDVQAYTEQLATDEYEPRDAEQPPWPFGPAETMLRQLGGLLGKPEAAVALVGFAAGMLWLRRPTLLPAAVAVAQCAVVFALAAFGLPVLTRFLFAAAAMLTVFAALAAVGWSALGSEHPKRRSWRIAGIGALLVFAVTAPAHIGDVEEVRDGLTKRDRVHSDLRELVRQPTVAAALETCRPIYALDSLPASRLAYWTDRDSSDILPIATLKGSAPGLLVVPASRDAWRLSNSSKTMSYRETRRQVPTTYHLVAREGSWELYTGCRRAG